MQFEKDGMHFQISHLERIVINTVRRLIEPAQGGKPAKVTAKYTRVEEPGTRVWVKLVFSQTERVSERVRWAKFRFSGNIDLPIETYQRNVKDAEQFASTEEIKEMIQVSMCHPDKDVWFSGSYCNIRITKNWQDVQHIQAQEERRKNRARAAKILDSEQVNELIQNAIRQSGANIQREYVNTPFGIIPSVIITGSGRRKLLKNIDEIEKNGTFVSLDEAAKILRIPRKEP